VCIDFKMLEVKAPVVFSGTWGFPPRRDERLGLRGSGAVSCTLRAAIRTDAAIVLRVITTLECVLGPKRF